MNVQNSNDKIKILKLEPVSNPQLKRRRSHSHNGADLSTNDMFKANNNNNHCQFYIQSHKESSPNESSQLKQIINNCSSPYLSNQLTKDKHKKETHNRVERKRRDFINCQIQKLAELLPTEFFLNCDLKMNKGVILKNSVEYITSMKLVEQINQQLIHENELGANLIRTLITTNDLNNSQISNTDNLNYTELTEDIDIGHLINQWYTVHQENKQFLQQFTQKLSNKNNNTHFGDVVMENIFVNDSKNNNNNSNPAVNSHIPCRKRYSSLPTNINPDSQIQRCQINSNVQLVPDKTSPILNSLLKKPNHHHFTHNETLEPIYRIDSNEESIDYYLRYSASPILGQNITTDNALIIETPNRDSIKDCKFVYSKEKTYYILPKSINEDFNTKLLENPVETCPEKMKSLDPGDHFNQSNDPMLLSTSPTHL